jgi:protocatechuate 3,4-dioxygenase beta subunit
MSRLTLALVFAATTASMVEAGQAQPARDVRAVAEGTAVVAGTVVTDDADARPVRHARVTLNGAEPFDGMTTITDDHGRFAFGGLPAGRFELAASKDGWVTSAYGAKRPLRPGTSLPVANGQTVDVTVRLVRGAVITGLLLDNTGQPSVGTTVRAMRYAVIDGQRRLRPSRASVTTDDRGVYRIYGLAPGEYVVGATCKPSYFGPICGLRLTTDIDVRDARSMRP